MKIFLHEIKDQETVLDFTQDEPWVVEAIARLDEKMDEKMDQQPDELTGRPIHALVSSDLTQSASRPTHVHFSLRNVDDVLVVTGSVDTTLRLVCSRCAAPFNFPVQPEFSALFCKDPDMAGVGHLDEDNRPAGQNKGFARHAHDSNSGKDLDITYLSDNVIDLSDVLSEQVQLQVPFQPLCKDDCKGICVSCGADLNIGRCACAKINPTNPFLALKDLKL